MSTQPEDLIAELRSKINPLYAAQMGTESYERRLCAEALEAQRAEILRLRREVARCHKIYGVRSDPPFLGVDIEREGR